MCCSMRATVLFLSSLHIWFASTQMVIIGPTMISNLSSRTMEAVMAMVFSVVYFSSGFLIFLGADEESTLKVGGGAITLVVILGERYTVMYFGLLLMPTLPESDFLNPYGVTVPVIFTVLLYVFYLSILFCYHNELKYSSPQTCLSPIICRRSLRDFPPTTPDSPPRPHK